MENFQVLADCAHCRVEGAVIEIFDQRAAACHMGVALESRCRMCGIETRGHVRGPGQLPERITKTMVEDRCPRCGGVLDRSNRHKCPHCHLEAFSEIIAPPKDLSTPQKVHDALERWASNENYGLVHEMLEASFGELTVEEIHQRLQRKERIETSFDVLGYLFAHMGGGQTMQGVSEEPPALGHDGSVIEDEDDGWGFAPTARIQLPSQRRPHRRNRALALVSVMAADGQIRDEERAFVGRLLQQEGLEPLKDEELRLHRPHEVGPGGSLKDREALSEMMVEVAHIDNERDETEMRIIREFGRAWGVDPARIERWTQDHESRSGSRIQRFFVKLKALMVGA